MLIRKKELRNRWRRKADTIKRLKDEAIKSGTKAVKAPKAPKSEAAAKPKKAAAPKKAPAKKKEEVEATPAE